MATMQGMEGTISEAGPGGYQLEQPAVIQSHLWKRMPEKFLKGEPKVLGVVQILIAMTNLSLEIIKMSAILPLSDKHSVSGLDVYIIGRPVMFIISGSLSVVAGVRTTKGLIQTSLGLNIFSSVLAGVGVPFTISSLEDFQAGVSACIFYQRLESCSMAMAILLSLDAVVLLLTVLEFFVALTLSAFGCKVTCCHPGGVVLILPSNPHVAETASPTPFTEV